MTTMKNSARRCATLPAEAIPAAAPKRQLGSPADYTFGASNLSLDAYLASSDFAPQSIEALREELDKSC